MRTQTLTKQMYTASLDRDRDFHFRVKRPGKRSDTFYWISGSGSNDAGSSGACFRLWC